MKMLQTYMQSNIMNAQETCNMSNLSLYNRFREVPQEAKKTIKGGKLNGFTDINPMWRIKKLTEEFGECGFGWYYEIAEKWKEACGQEVAVFVKINLYIKRNNEWSAPIMGVGGSKMVQLFKGGEVVDFSDEAYKMALTDAISIACKALGMGADVYFANDRTKYDQSHTQPTQQAQSKSKTYTPMEDSQFWAVIDAYARRKPTKTGGDYRQTWIEMTGAGKNEIAMFDKMVVEYMLKNNLQ